MPRWIIEGLARVALLSAVGGAAIGCDGTLGPERGPPCTAGTVCTVVGTGALGVGDDGLSAHETPLYLPVDVTVGPEGGLYVVDFNNHRVVLVDEEGIARRVAGAERLGDGPPGPATASALLHPSNVAFDADGGMLIAAWHNYRIKRVEDGHLEDVAGTGEGGYDGDDGPASAAQLDLPSGIAVDAAGDVFFADQGNQVIRRIAQDGTVSRFAGRCVVGECGPDEVPATCPDEDREWCASVDECTGTCVAAHGGDGGDRLDARFGFAGGSSATPSGRITFGPDGALYVVDTENHRVRRVDSAGVVTTVVGSGQRGVGGDGGPATEARLDSPSDAAFGPDGTLYVADTESSCVRAVGTDGVITTLAGRCGMRGDRGDGGPPEDALFDTPYGIDVDAAGRVFVADSFNHRVRMITPH